MYILNLLDYQSGGVSLIFLALVEVLVVAWGYGMLSVMFSFRVKL